MTSAADERPDLVLGPDEIVNYPLRKATRGYQVTEVDDLLDQLAVQTKRLLESVQRLEEERDRLQEQLSEANETESLLKKTLVTAQRAAEASVAEAHEEAEQLRAAAREKVEQLLADAAEQAHELREAALRRARADQADARRHRRAIEDHVEALRTFAEDHRARLGHHLELQRERLDEMELPPAPAAPQPEEHDEILQDDVGSVGLEQIMAELTADGTPGEPDDQPDGDEPAVGEGLDGDEPDGDEPDEPDEPDDDDAAAPLFHD